MESKFKKLENLMATEGLTCNDVIGYCMAKQDKEGLIQKRRAEEAERRKIAATFPADDIRSKAFLYDYAFEGGKFSTDPNAYPNCQGVVGWINPDPNAPDGDKIYVVLPEQQSLQYSTKFVETGANDLYDGRANTLNLIEYGKKHNVNFPPAEFAFNYCKNGVKKGEAFWPAREQLKRVCANCDCIREALRLIAGTFNGWLWSSSEYSSIDAWHVYSNDGNMDCSYKHNDYNSVSCLLAY